MFDLQFVYDLLSAAGTMLIVIGVGYGLLSLAVDRSL